MRRTVALAAMVLFVCLVASNTQATTSRVELELGSVTVWLGMPKALAEKQLTEAGYRLRSGAGTDSMTWQAGSDNEGRYYTLEFGEGKLSYADREWWKKGENPFEAVLAALGALAEKTTTPCFITRRPLNEPDLEVDRIVIDCGQRGALLMRGHSRKSDAKTIDVVERIGKMH